MRKIFSKITALLLICLVAIVPIVGGMGTEKVEAGRPSHDVRIYKIDAATGENLLANNNALGAEFKLVYEDGTDFITNVKYRSDYDCLEISTDGPTADKVTGEIGWTFWGHKASDGTTDLSEKVFTEPLTLKLIETKAPEGYELDKTEHYIYFDENGHIINNVNKKREDIGITGLQYVPYLPSVYENRGTGGLSSTWIDKGLDHPTSPSHHIEYPNRKINTSSFSVLKKVTNDDFDINQKFKFKVKLTSDKSFELKRYIIKEGYEIVNNEENVATSAPAEDEYTIIYSLPNDSSIVGYMPSVNVKYDEDYYFPTEGVYYKAGYEQFGWAVFGPKSDNYKSAAYHYNTYTPNPTPLTIKHNKIEANLYKPGDVVKAYPSFYVKDAIIDMKNGEFEFEIKAGEKAFFDGIPVGTKYEIYEETPEGWVIVDQKNTTGVIEADKESEVEFTNEDTRTATVNIQGTKTWDDANNQDGKRPESITVNLLADGVEVDEKEVSGDWTYGFNDLPKYKDGKEITYTITEDKVEGYTTTIEGYDITNTYTPETIKIEGSKTWDDANNQDGKRPENITINLFADGEKVDSKQVSGVWKWLFDNLAKYKNGKEINYTITEDKIDEYTSTIDGYNVTNKYTPKKTEINVTKTWDDADNQDGKRPSNVTVNLLADGEKIDSKTIAENDNWTCKFDNLPQYKEGKEISYTITEEPVADYTSTVNGYNITNSYTPGKTQVDVAKVWDDANNQDGKRPEKVTVKLFADGQDTGKTLELNETNKWTGSFINLDEMKAGEKITYTIDETDVAGYTKSIDGYTITNSYKPETVTVEGTKTWNDADNQDGKRPESITVNLLADGVEIDKKQTTDDKWIFENLPKCKDGKEIVYTITEDEVPGYTSTIDGYNITNSYTPEVISVEGIKTWDDADNKDGIRPKSITVNLLADGEQIDSVEAIDTYSFKDLPKYKDGKEIVYTITEIPVDGYETIIDGYNITNRHIPIEEPVNEPTESPTETSTEEPTDNIEDVEEKDGEQPAETPIEGETPIEIPTEPEETIEESYQIPESTTVADTGDKSILPLIIAGILSAAGIIATGVALKKRKHN